MKESAKRSFLPWYILPIVWGLLWIPLSLLLLWVWEVINPKQFTLSGSFDTNLIEALTVFTLTLAAVLIGSFATGKIQRVKSLTVTATVIILALLLLGLKII